MSMILKKYPESISISKHVRDALRRCNNKNEAIEEILIENLDRVNGGDISEMIQAREIQLRGMVAKVVLECKQEINEVETVAVSLQESLRSLQELKLTSKDTNENLKGILQTTRELEKILSSTGYTDNLVEKICQKIYDDTQEMAEDMHEV